MRERSRVLGVDVDLARHQGIEDEARATEGLTMLGRRLRRREGACQLAEHDALGEVLRADHDGALVWAGIVAGRREEKAADQHEAGRESGTPGAGSRLLLHGFERRALGLDEARHELVGGRA